jgi:Putative transmembrane protein (PGPGW)
MLPDPEPSPAAEVAPAPAAADEAVVRKVRAPLSLITRVLLHSLGWALVAVGLAGLVLPGIQGVLTLALGFAVISVASKRVHRWLRGRFRRWPKGWRRLERARRRVDRWVRPKE